MSGHSSKRLTPAIGGARAQLGTSSSSNLPIPVNSGIRARSNSPTKKRLDRPDSDFNSSTSSLLSADSKLLEPIPQHLLPPAASGRKVANNENEDDTSSVASSEHDRSSMSIFGAARDLLWKNTGIVLVLAAQFFGSLMALATRLLETSFETKFQALQILFVRMAFMVVMGSLYMWWARIPDFPLGMKEVRWLLALRGFGGFFDSLTYLELSDAIVITFLSPTLAGYVASIFLNEPFTRIEKFGGGIAFIGVVLIARPTSFFSRSPDGSTVPVTDASSSANNSDVAPPMQRLVAVLVALLGVCGAATAYVSIRAIGKRAHPLISVNYFAVWCIIVSFFGLLFIPGLSFQFPQGIQQWMLLGLIVITGFGVQFLLTAGLQLEKAGRATNMIYSQMIFALMWERIVWGTTPGWMSLLGSGLILGSVLWVALWKQKDKVVKIIRSVQPTNDQEGDEERGLVARRRSSDEMHHSEHGEEDEMLNEHEERALNLDPGIQLNRLASH